MKLVVDAELCQGHGRCYDIAPALVGADDEGHATVLTAGRALAAADGAAADSVVRNCPEGALSLEP